MCYTYVNYYLLGDNFMSMEDIKTSLKSLSEDHLEALYRNLSRQDITILGKHSILATQPDLDKETKINLMSENITEPSDFCKKINDSLKDVNIQLFLAESPKNNDIFLLKQVLDKISSFGDDNNNIQNLSQQLEDVANSKNVPISGPRTQ